MIQDGKTLNKRYEDVFVIDNMIIDEYIRLNKESLTSKFTPDLFKEDASYTYIENTYFDNHSLESFHHAMEKKKSRKELRIRTYAIDGVEEDVAYFEIKSKNFMQTIKERVAFKKSSIQAFVEKGEYNEKELVELNPGEKKSHLLEKIQKITFLIQQSNYRPILVTSYKRKAYKAKKPGTTLRITIDKDIQFKRLCKTVEPEVECDIDLPEGHSVIEFKFKGKNDLAHVAEIRKILGDPEGFSKYCYGIYNTDLSSIDDFDNGNQHRQVMKKYTRPQEQMSF